MTTIVMNTINAAVTEWDWAFQSISPTSAGDASGLYALGGDTDGADGQIATDMLGGKTLQGDENRKILGHVYFAIKGEAGAGALVVQGEADEWEYEFPMRPDGLTRAKPGQGIRENYLAFGHKNRDGRNFTLDRMKVEVFESKNRRIA